MQGIETIPTDGPHPVVYAEWLGAANKPTILIYAHYDVQPVSIQSFAAAASFRALIQPRNTTP